MRTIAIATLLAAAVVTLGAPASSARSLDGTVKVGGVFLDQTGDRTAVQEISDVYDGFALSQIRLDGSLDPRQYVMLDLRDINLDSRQGDLLYRMPGTLKLTAGYVQHRRIFSPDGAVNSDRKDWRAGAQVTPQPGDLEGLSAPVKVGSCTVPPGSSNEEGGLKNISGSSGTSFFRSAACLR